MQNYFDENKADFDQQEQVSASHLLVEDEETALDIREKLLSGEDFTELEKEYSIDTSISAYGGDLGFFGAGEMVSEFEEAAFSLAIGEISEVINTDYGYHIIKVDERQEKEVASFSDFQDEIKETLIKEKMQTEYTIWIDEISSDYEVDHLLD